MRPPKLPQYLDISKERLPKLPLSPFLDSSGQPPKLLLRLDIFKGQPPRSSSSWPGYQQFRPTHLLLCLPIARKFRRDTSTAISASVDVGAPMVHRMVQKGDMATDVSRSYGDRIVHNNGGGRVYSYGTRRGYRKENRNVRSYGDRRVYSYGERQGFSYGDRYRRWCLYDRKRQPVVQSGHSESESGKWFRTRLTASDIKLTASRVGAFWVAGHFLTTFTHNLNFNNLPAILIEKYQLAGNEVKSLSQAQAVWESIPVQVRAGGPEALWKLHQGKQWSHIIPKSLGGPSTADNAIWWGSEKNRALGAKLMSQADIADAKAVLRSDAIRATFAQTATSMVRGAMVAVVVDGALACLECGLDYAEGKITWREMVQMVVRSGVIAGGGAFITTGLIVGISLLFPFLIPILTPVLFVLQATSLAFLGAKGVRLAKGWMAVLDRQQLLDHSAFGEAVKAFPRTVKALPSMASRNIYRSGSSLIGRALDLSARKAAQALPWKANVTAKELSV